MKQISFKGVAIGNVVDILASNVVMIPVMIYFAASARMGSEPIAPESITETLRASNAFFAVSSVLGGLCSVLGGYVSARIAKHDEVLNGALSSILCVGLGIYTIVNGTDHLWRHLLYLLLSPTFGALGGYLQSWRAARIA